MKNFYLKTALALLCTLLGMSVQAQDFGVDGLYYEVTGNDEVVLWGFDGDEFPDLVIPATVTYDETEYKVTSIGENAFAWLGTLETVTFGSNVKVVGNEAFRNCSSLREVTLNDGLENIGENVFTECQSLESISIPGSVTRIGSNAFGFCDNLGEVTLNEGLEVIGDGAFYNTSLETVSLPNSVTSIEGWAFGECYSLSEVTLNDGLLEIGEGAFYMCQSLESINIPSSVTTIGNEAFSDCSSLTVVTVGWDVPIEVEDLNFTFYNIDSENVILGVPDGKVIVYRSSQWGNVFTNIAEASNIPVIVSFESGGLWYKTTYSGTAKVIASKGEAYSGDIVIPATVTTTIDEKECTFDVESFDDGIFANNGNITSIDIQSAITSIPDYCFQYCSGLSSVTLPSCLTEIGSYAFYYNTSLTEINIPDNVSNINPQTFYKCSSLKTVTLGEGVDFIDSNSFSYCTALEKFIVKNEACSAYYNWRETPNPFYGTPIENVCLVVPDGTLDYYQYSNPWRNFGIKIEQSDADKKIQRFEFNDEEVSVSVNGVSVAKGGYLLLDEGTNMVITFTPQEGYVISSITDNDNDVTSELSDNTLTYENVNEDHKFVISMYNNRCTQIFDFDDEKVSITVNGEEVESGETVKIDKGTDMVIKFIPKDGYAIDFVNDHVNNDDYDVTSEISDNTLTYDDVYDDHDFYIEMLTSSITFAQRYMTFSSKRGVDFTDTDVKAWTVTGYNNGRVQLSRVNVIPAGQGALLEATEGTKLDLTFTDASPFFLNMLVGVPDGDYVSTTGYDKYNNWCYNFILGEGTQGLGFYRMSESGNIAAGKAYLPIPTNVVEGSNAARGFGLEFDDKVTGINETLKKQQKMTGEIHDMLGRKVGNMQKNVIYIVNGEKFVVE